MRILVAGNDDDTRRELALTLQRAGHAVRTAQDDRGTLAALLQESPQVVLLATDTASRSALAQIRQIRDHARSPATHLVLVAPDLTEAFSIDAYEAGLDGDIRAPYAADYLLARVGAIQRRVDPAARARGSRVDLSGAKPAPAPPGNDVSSSVSKIAGSKTWREGPESLRAAASKFLTSNASVGDAPAFDHCLSLGCSIGLSNIESQLELRVALGADEASGRHLAGHLFGPEGEGLIQDMLGETANIFMGALKTSFGAESLAFTGGLPEPISTELVLRPTATYKLQEVFTLTLVGAVLVVHLGLRSKANLAVVPSQLEEGMVLAKDVFSPKGLMLVAAGTRLSQNMIGKLRGILPAKQPVEVMPP